MRFSTMNYNAQKTVFSKKITQALDELLDRQISPEMEARLLQARKIAILARGVQKSATESTEIMLPLETQESSKKPHDSS